MIGTEPSGHRDSCSPTSRAGRRTLSGARSRDGRRSRSAPSCRSRARSRRSAAPTSRRPELAVKEINDAGGVKVGGKPMKIELTLLDDTSDAAKSAQLVEQLITQQKVRCRSSAVTARTSSRRRVSCPSATACRTSPAARARAASTGAASGSSGRSPRWTSCRRREMDFLSALVAAGKLKKPLEDRARAGEHRARQGLRPGSPRLPEGASGRFLDRGRRELRARIPRTSSLC